MPLPKKKFYTEEEYETFENDGLTEYNRGEIIAMAPRGCVNKLCNLRYSTNIIYNMNL